MTAEPSYGPDRWLARLADVRDAGDRRATAPLVDLLLRGDLDEETVEDVADVLCVLEDPRCERPLTALLLDTARPETLRGAALRVLSCLPCDDPPPLRVARWLDDADGLVRAHAAGFLGPSDERRLAALAHDPVVEVRRAATEALVGAARTPALVAAVRGALRDPDAIVREIACRAALFDEPVAATYDLLHLLDDPDSDVRMGVYDALEDYPCVAVLLALADARSGPDGGLAAVTLEVLVTRFGAALGGASGAGVRRILRWAAPARWVLEEELESLGDDAAARAVPSSAPAPVPSASPGDEPRPAVDLPAALRALPDPETPAARQRELLVAHDWGTAGPVGLGLLRRVAETPLWSLRHAVAVALLDLVRAGVPGAAEALLELACDREAVVRRVAIHALTHAQDPRAVEPALAVLCDERMRPLAGDAALTAVARLAPGDVAGRAVIAELMREGDRDGLALGAVHLAESLGLAAAVPHLCACVARDVVAGVGVHVAALCALRTLGAPRRALDLAHLDGLDHLDVQAELGAWDWHGRRYG